MFHSSFVSRWALSNQGPDAHAVRSRFNPVMTAPLCQPARARMEAAEQCGAGYIRRHKELL